MKPTPSTLLGVVLASVIVAIPLGLVIFSGASLVILLAVLVIVLLIPLFLVNEYWALLTLLVVRPMADTFGESSITLLNRFTVNFASLLSVLVIVWCVAFLLRTGLRRVPLTWPIAIFLLATAASIPGSVDVLSSVMEYVRLASIFLLYGAAATIVQTEQRFRGVVRALLVSAVVPVSVALYQLFAHAGFTFGDVGNRLFGTFGHPNVLAFYLVLLLSVGLGMLLARSPQQSATNAWVGIGLLCLVLLLTYTRGAWLGFLIVAAFYGMQRRPKVVLWSGGILLALFLLEPTINRFLFNTFDFNLERTPVMVRLLDKQSDDSSVQFRLRLWSEMRPKFGERPVVGHGLGTFPIVREQQIIGFFQGTEAHNDYLRLAIETGALGFASYVLLLVALCVQLLRTYRALRSTRYGTLALGMIGFFFAFLVMSFFDNLLQGTAVMWAMWVLLGALFVLPKTLQKL